MELGKTALEINRAGIGFDFQTGNDFPESRCPGIEMLNPHFIHLARDQVAHHGVHFGQAIGDGCRRRKGNSSLFLFIEIFSHHKQIERTLRAGRVQSGNPVHLGLDLQVLESMSFINKDVINA